MTSVSGLGRHEEAIVAYGDLLSRFADATEPALYELIAQAAFNRAVDLGELNRHEEEIAAYDDLLDRFGVATELRLRQLVADAALNKAIVLGELNRQEEAILAYDDLLGRLGVATELPLRQLVADAALNKAVVLGELDRQEEAIVAYDDLLGRLGDATEPSLREHIATALSSKGSKLRAVGRRLEALAAYREALEIRPDASGYLNLGTVLFDLGHERPDRLHEAIAAFDNAIKLDPHDPTAHTFRGAALRKAGRHDEAFATYGHVLALKPDTAKAHVAHARALIEVGSIREAIAACKRAIDLDPNNPIAHALQGKALGEIGHFNEAIAACDRAIELDPGYHLPRHTRDDALWKRWLEGWGKRVKPKTFARAGNPDYYQNIMNKRAQFYALADRAWEQLSIAEFKEAIDSKLAAKAQAAARETTARAKVKARPVSPQRAVEGSALVRLRSKYDYLLAYTRLPKEIDTKEDAQLAGRLVETYRALRKQELAMGLKPTLKDNLVKDAHRLRVAFYRKQRAEKPPRRRARPGRKRAVAPPV